MLNSLLLCFCIILLNLQVKGQSFNLDAKRFELLKDRDTFSLKQILHDSLTYIHSNGLEESKKNIIQSMTSGKIVYQKFKFINRSLIFRNQEKLAFKGIVLVDGLYEGQSFQIKLAFTSFYKRYKKRFQLFYWQSTKL